jgi:hypothetical protein
VTNSPPDDEGRTIKPFAATLQEIAAGAFHTRVSEQLQDLVTAVTDTGKKGVLTVTLTVAPIKPGNTTNLVVTGKATVKAPESDDAAPSSVFFHDAAGNLSRNDPNQPALPLRGLETQTRRAVNE